jgi:hypothetical protein
MSGKTSSLTTKASFTWRATSSRLLESDSASAVRGLLSFCADEFNDSLAGRYCRLTWRPDLSSHHRLDARDCHTVTFILGKSAFCSDLRRSGLSSEHELVGHLFQLRSNIIAVAVTKDLEHGFAAASFAAR